MKRIGVLSRIALAAALPVVASGVGADAPRLASVAISNVAEDVARNTGIDSSRIPLNVQVPMDVAATVCGLAANVLARQAETGLAQCTAQRTSTELDDIVRNRVRDNAGN